MPAFEVTDLELLYKDIVKIDNALDEASGSEAAAKRKVSELIVDETATSWKKLVDSLITNLKKIEDPRLLAGAYTAIRQNLSENFRKGVDEYITSQIPEKDPNAPAVPDEKIKELNLEAANLRKKYATMRELLEMFDENVDHVPVPKKRTGSRGKRGPRVLVGYQWAVDGKDRSESTNNLSAIANTVAGPEITNTQQLRDWLSGEGLDLQNPPTKFAFTLPNGKVLSAKFEQKLADQEPDEEDEEVEDETEEVE